MVGFGSVLVEKRVWKYMRAHRVRGSDQIGEVADHLAGVQPALEHLGAGAQRQRVQAGELRAGVRHLLDLHQGGVGGAVHVGAGLVGRRGEDPLHDRAAGSGSRPGGSRCCPPARRVREQVQSLRSRSSRGPARAPPRPGPASLGRNRLRDAEPPTVRSAAGERAEEAHRQVEADPGAVADALRRHAAAVRDGAQRLSPRTMTSWVCRPSLRVMKPTPHALDSRAGSYKPNG